MFTRDFSKLRLVLVSAGSLALLFLTLNVGLLCLSNWAEVRYGLYPWRDEDYLRFLLPSMFESRGHDRILLAGPSEVREGLLEEVIDSELPGMRTFNAAQSVGTLDDLLLALAYIEKVYGDDAKPKVLVVGITPRFVANIRSADQKSPLVTAINRYSPYYRVEQTSHEGSRLASKTWWERLISRQRFLPKQRARYRPALSALAYATYGRLLDKVHLIERLGLKRRLEHRVYSSASPYLYHKNKPWSPDELEGALTAPESFWSKSRAWIPNEDATAVRQQITMLKELSRSWGTRLYVINLPEHPLVRERFLPHRYQEYLELVREALGDTPLLNLRDLLDRDEFYDLAHPTLAGARRETAEVVHFLKTGGGVTSERVAAR